MSVVTVKSKVAAKSGARRALVPIVAAAALILSGCGTTHASQAATVNGTVISNADVASVTEQINSMDPALLQNLDTKTTLGGLIQSSVILPYLEERGLAMSDSVARRTLSDAHVSDPSDATVDFIRFVASINDAQQSGSLTDNDLDTLTKQLNEINVDINPRYGTYEIGGGGVQPATPAWIDTKQ